MQLSPLTQAGQWLASSIIKLHDYTQIAINITVGIVLVLLLARLLTDLLRLNPFGRTAYYLRRPTDTVLDHMRSSQFYYPLKQALNFNPAMLMALIALAILWYVVSSVLGYLFTTLQGVSMSLTAFGTGHPFYGASYLVGCCLLAVIFYLLALMTIIFVYWIFGLLSNAARWALHRIGPLLTIFEFGGSFRGWSFIILGIALSFAAAAVQLVFFPSLPMESLMQ